MIQAYFPDCQDPMVFDPDVRTYLSPEGFTPSETDQIARSNVLQIVVVAVEVVNRIEDTPFQRDIQHFFIDGRHA